MIAFLSALLFSAQSAETAPLPCIEAEAERTTVVEIASDPDRFLDRCVTVTGPAAGIYMFSGREGMYLAYRFGADGNPSPEARLHRIGIDRQDFRNLQMRYPQQTTVTGRVDSCERRYRRIADAGGIPFLGGYCHYFGGPTIVADHYTITERRFERMVGEAHRPAFGSLAFMPADWPRRAELDAAVAGFVAALRAGDRARLIDLHEFTKPDTNEHHRRVLYELTQDPNSVFRELRQGHDGQIAYFVLAADDGSPLGRDDPGPAGFVCFCRTDDCIDRWPIALNDTNNAPDRPFACTHVEARNYRADPVFVTDVGGGWLLEPPSTAMSWPD